MSHSWTPNQRKYIEWRATPRYDRIPPTRELLAKELGVNRRTFSRWQNLPGFQEAVTARAEELLSTELPDVYGALITKAKMLDVPAIKLVLELTGRYTPTQKNEQSGSVTLNVHYVDNP